MIYECCKWCKYWNAILDCCTVTKCSGGNDYASYEG